MAIIVPSPHSGCPVRVREQDVGRAVRDESGRIFYPLPKREGDGHYGALTRTGSDEQEERCAEMGEAYQRQPPAESPSVEAHDATGPGRRRRPVVWLISLAKVKAARRAIIYLLFLAVCLEVGARVILSSKLIGSLVQGNHDYGHRQGWLNRRRSQPSDTAIAYEFDEYHQELGWKLKSHVRDLLVWDGKSLNTNSRGLRGSTEYPYDRVPNRIRIAVLGDSFTFGEEVSDHETFCAWLERLIPDSEVLNFGNHGYGHDQMLIYFRSEVRRYSPDIVILGFVTMDMERNLHSFKDYAKPRFELDKGRLVPRNLPVPPPEHFLRSDWYRCKLFDLFAIIIETLRWKSGSMEPELFQLTGAILGDLADEVSQIKARPVFVFFPVLGLIGDTGPRPSNSERFLMDFCVQRDGLEGLSLQPRFDAEYRKGSALERKYHWNAYGHAVAAAEIKRFLEAKNLIPAHP